MQLTIDSTESIDRVLPAIGAMFGVRVQVTPSSTDTAAAAPADNKPITRRRAVAKRTARKQPSPRARAGKADDSALVREWARANGFRVADRGRISAAVRTAYRAA